MKLPGLHLSFYGLEIDQPAEWTAFIIVIVIITLALWRTSGAKGFWDNHRIVGGKISPKEILKDYLTLLKTWKILWIISLIYAEWLIITGIIKLPFFSNFISINYYGLEKLSLPLIKYGDIGLISHASLDLFNFNRLPFVYLWWITGIWWWRRVVKRRVSNKEISCSKILSIMLILLPAMGIFYMIFEVMSSNLFLIHIDAEESFIMETLFREDSALTLIVIFILEPHVWAVIFFPAALACLAWIMVNFEIEQKEKVADAPLSLWRPIFLVSIPYLIDIVTHWLMSIIRMVQFTFNRQSYPSFSYSSSFHMGRYIKIDYIENFLYLFIPLLVIIVVFNNGSIRKAWKIYWALLVRKPWIVLGPCIAGASGLALISLLDSIIDRLLTNHFHRDVIYWIFEGVILPPPIYLIKLFWIGLCWMAMVRIYRDYARPVQLN